MLEVIHGNSILVVLNDYLGMTRNIILYFYFIKIQAFNWSLFLSYAFQVLIISILSVLIWLSSLVIKLLKRVDYSRTIVL